MAAVGGLLVIGSLFTVWCRTPGGVGLFGRPNFDVTVERFGVDYIVTGLVAVALVAVVAVASSRWGAIPAGAGAVLLTARAMLGDERDTVVGPVDLRTTLLLGVAVVISWGIVIVAVRSRP